MLCMVTCKNNCYVTYFNGICFLQKYHGSDICFSLHYIKCIQHLKLCYKGQNINRYRHYLMFHISTTTLKLLLKKCHDSWDSLAYSLNIPGKC